MTDVQPRARVRSPQPGASVVNPPPRTRVTPTTFSPPKIVSVARVHSPISTPNALPLGMLQKSHNGVEHSAGDVDPRFAPLIIVVRRDWLANMPEPYKTRQDEALTWAVGAKFPDTVWATPVFFTEWALRHYCHKALLADDLFAALEAHLISVYDDWNAPAKCMTKIVGGRIIVDMTTSTGPFYLDSVACIDKHYATRCRDWRPNLSLDNESGLS